LIDKLPHAVSGGMLFWYREKMFIEHASVISSDAIHVLIGVVIWVAAALVSRRPLATWLPLLAVLALTLLNEAVDLSVERWPSLAMQLGESAKDIILTMGLPTLLMTLVRLRPNLFRTSTRRR
jgi:diacylglycerol kinase